MTQYGETLEDYLKRREEKGSGGSGGGDVWIKPFPKGDTRVRFVDEPGKWYSYIEHYTPTGGYFACNRAADCPGCNEASEDWQKVSRRFVAHCINENGYVDLRKVPWTLIEDLMFRFQRAGTLTDRDYVINRRGDGKDTKYSFDADEKYPVDLDAVERHDVKAIVEAQRVKAWQKYGAAAEEGDGVPDEAQAAAPSGDGTLALLHAGKLPVEDVDTSDLREFAKVKGIEVPPRAPRARLESAISKWIETNPPF